MGAPLDAVAAVAPPGVLASHTLRADLCRSRRSSKERGKFRPIGQLDIPGFVHIGEKQRGWQLLL